MLFGQYERDLLQRQRRYMIYSSESDDEVSRDLVVSNRKDNLSHTITTSFEDNSEKLRNILKEYEEKQLEKM